MFMLCSFSRTLRTPFLLRAFSAEPSAKIQQRKQKYFRQLISNLDNKSSSFLENAEYCKSLEEKYNTVLSAVHLGGGEKATARHKQQKKLLARERISRLLDDDGDFLELSPFAGMGMDYGDIPAAGLVAGIGRVHGVRCMIGANDATVKGGTLFPIGVKKQLRIQEIAQENKLPCIYLVDSGGAFLPLQSEIFLPGGRTFYNEAIMSSMNIPQVAIVCGSCTAGGAYLPTMADEAVIVHKIGTIFLGGPPLVQAATGEVVSAEDLGGATLHSSVSGCTDYFATTEEEAFEMGRDIVASLNMPESNRPDSVEPPLYDPENICGVISPDSANIDPYEVISHITDASRFHEFKATYGKQLVAGFAKVQGYLVGILANKGVLAEDAAVKGSHFVQLCSQRNVPMVFLQNVPTDVPDSFSPGEGEIYGAMLAAQGRMMAAVACSLVPKITIVLGGSYGATNYAMGGRSFQPNFLFSWPSAQICMSPPDLMARQIIQKNSAETNADFDKKVAELGEKLSAKSSAFYSSSRLWDDGVVLPQDTRKVLGQCLEIVTQSSLASEMKIPFMRM